MNIEQISPEEAYQRTLKGVTYLDVRTPEEYNENSAEHSINIPVFFKQNGALIPNHKFIDLVQEKFDKNTPLILGCRSGGRSMNAATILKENGFTTLANLEGGFIEWVASSLPTSN